MSPRDKRAFIKSAKIMIGMAAFIALCVWKPAVAVAAMIAVVVGVVWLVVFTLCLGGGDD